MLPEIWFKYNRIKNMQSYHSFNSSNSVCMLTVLLFTSTHTNQM